MKPATKFCAPVLLVTALLAAYPSGASADPIPHEVAHAVAHGNAERLWNLPPAT